MLKHFLSPPNWFTSASIFCGFYAILLAAGNDGDAATFYQAGLLIGFAGVFDMLDGRVARMTNSSSAFGVQLDSLADVVSFGVAPAVLVYKWGLDSLGLLGLAAAFGFVLCGIFRLARFNVGAANDEEFAYSKGLTITMAGGTLAAMVMLHAAMGLDFVKHPTGALVSILVMAFLMVSNVPYPTAKALRMGRGMKAFLILLAGSLVVVGVFFDISFIVLPVMAIYAASGPFVALAGFRNRRAQARVRRDD
ncbi:MAG: CDP-diacylglycerol--serine O-phosphatidyltransferase [Proteobacteria bacterium]|nr:CDP-diacylglycerol--serine O-phosphatidyltransferase [Pseudomonadota bacterium]MCP4920318.1 CDP-diacylglycerol--serine O-phosphatidyltransferase [Pseudomonadota bacterium]